jgi:hypothetical protein
MIGDLESRLHHRWARAAAVGMSRHQSQPSAAVGAEEAPGRTAKIARLVIVGPIPS